MTDKLLIGEGTCVFRPFAFYRTKVEQTNIILLLWTDNPYSSARNDHTHSTCHFPVCWTCRHFARPGRPSQQRYRATSRVQQLSQRVQQICENESPIHLCIQTRSPTRLFFLPSLHEYQKNNATLRRRIGKLIFLSAL